MTHQNNPDSSLEIGYILSAHGLRGEVKARLHNPHSNAFDTLEEVIVRTRAGVEQEFSVEYVQPIPKKGFILGLEGIQDRTMAESLKGATLFAKADSLDNLQEGEFFLEQIRGFDATDVTTGLLGKVEGFIFTNIDILSIRRPDGGEILVPLLKGTIVDMDPEEKTLQLRLPEGLLEE